MKIYQAEFCCGKMFYLDIANAKFSPNRILYTLLFWANRIKLATAISKPICALTSHYYFPIHKLLRLISADEMALFIIIIIIIIIITGIIIIVINIV